MLMYGRGPASIAEQIHGTVDQAKAIINDFYSAYPQVRQWMDNTVRDAKQKGYVETLWGRRRHLPDIQLPEYDIQSSSAVPEDFNPLFGFGQVSRSTGPSREERYLTMLKNARGWRDVQAIKEKAASEGITIKDNGGFISTAERQAVNSRIQGSAADQSKRAMIAVYNNQRLRELGFRLMLAVHDELIGECPVENAKEVGEIFSQIMRDSAKPACVVPMKSDSEYSYQWYGESIDVDSL